jgi:hypothetical protein
MSPLSPFAVVLGLVAGYLAATLSESLLHHHFGHASVSFRTLWKGLGRIGQGFARTFYSHAVVHHGRTFRVDYITQFADEGDKRALDDDLERRGWAIVADEGYGLTIGLTGFANFLLLPLVALPLVHVAAGRWATLAAFAAMLSTPLLSRYVHPYLHKPHAEAMRCAPLLIRLLLGTRYMRQVARHHYVHHRHPNCNFNLLLGGDWLLGVHRAADPDDLRRMRALGLTAAARR